MATKTAVMAETVISPLGKPMDVSGYGYTADGCQRQRSGLF
jgi:hypothetical protein